MTPVVRRLLGFVRPHARTLVLGLMATAVFAVLDAAAYVLLIPFVEALFTSGGSEAVRSGSAMDRVLAATVYRWADPAGGPLEAVNRIILLLMFVFVAKNLALFARSYLSARVEQGVGRDLRNAVYERLLGLDLAFFARVRTGQIVSRLTTEIEQVRALVTAEAGRLIAAGLAFSVAVGAMLLISWKLTVAAFLVIPGAMAIWGPLVAVLRRRDHGVLRLGGEVNAHVQETIQGIRLVKSAAAEGRERKRFRALTQGYLSRFMKAEWVRAWAAPGTEILAALGTGILLWYGARLVVGGELSGAELVGFLGLSLKLYAPVKQVAKFPATAQPGLVAAERVFELLDTSPHLTEHALPERLPGFRDEIVFEGVTFGYEAEVPVLQDVSFRIPCGSVVALVGPSGSGKSTVIDLLARFYDVQGGRITIDGIDLRRLALADLRSLVGVVSQEAVLFHDTVRANIAYAAPDADDAQVAAAARAAHVDEFVSALPRGYDTVVGERGVTLSGGQRQRVAIARALLANPPILVLDEATSALDSRSERIVRDAVEQLRRGRTVLVVAHRLSTVAGADQVVVLEHGRVVEQGSHEELVARGGCYRHLYDSELAVDEVVGA